MMTPCFLLPLAGVDTLTFPDFSLARRLEEAEARIKAKRAHTYAQERPESDAAVLYIAGGCAIHVALGCPPTLKELTNALGLGLNQPVSEDARTSRKTAMRLCRILEVGLGRNRIVGTTVRRTSMPEHLLADEHHQSRDGVKNYLATTVGEGCCLGAALAATANADDLMDAYEVFKGEAQNVQPGYRPQTVSTASLGGYRR
jgi:hypothetical protein